ncbi:hypothetical protein SCHPADRAFT_1001838 [Schizopora paradoxa]|uniref:BTB domain-containing protein n=1 Tax=Schizopora paradoxa TaxID=27342 RepID=A0A0H2R605_9AGAM|nr:hypothetical protein SCHPADRAFT_1001838 [Schizopora paradoxa]
MDVSEDAPISTTAPKQHETLWLSDGNVVLATKTYLFRVHKSVLAMRSRIVPELCEGIPMVALEDEGKDVEHLLKAIYESRYYNTNEDHHTIDKACALLKLSSKYNFQGILVDVIEHLSRIYPYRLQDYEAIYRDLPMRYDLEGGRHASYHLLAPAIQAGIDELFPALYYECALEPFSRFRHFLPDTPAGWTALERLVAGQIALKDAGPRIMSTFVGVTEKCVNDHKRGTEDFEGEHSWHPDYCDHFKTMDLAELIGYDLSESIRDRLCVECLAGVDEAIEDDRGRIWNKLPEYFGLGNWAFVCANLRARIEDRA